MILPKNSVLREIPFCISILKNSLNEFSPQTKRNMIEQIYIPVIPDPVVDEIIFPEIVNFAPETVKPNTSMHRRIK